MRKWCRLFREWCSAWHQVVFVRACHRSALGNSFKISPRYHAERCLMSQPAFWMGSTTLDFRAGRATILWKNKKVLLLHASSPHFISADSKIPFSVSPQTSAEAIVWGTPKSTWRDLFLTFHKIVVRSKYNGFIFLHLLECFWCFTSVYGMSETLWEIAESSVIFPHCPCKSSL